MFNRGHGGFGGGFGRGGFGGFGKRGFGPRFERGDMKLVVLDLLQEKPRHGYDIIQELQTKFKGFYNPSAGVIYPTLQLLEDQDLVTSDQKTSKKVYTLTDQGKQYLQEHQEELNLMKERMTGPWGEHGAVFAQMREDFSTTAALVFGQARQGNLTPEKLDKLAAAFKALREQVEQALSQPA